MSGSPSSARSRQRSAVNLIGGVGRSIMDTSQVWPSPSRTALGGGQVPAGRAVRRRGRQQRLAVPVEGQPHQVTSAEASSSSTPIRPPSTGHWPGPWGSGCSRGSPALTRARCYGSLCLGTAASCSGTSTSRSWNGFVRGNGVLAACSSTASLHSPARRTSVRSGIGGTRRHPNSSCSQMMFEVTAAAAASGLVDQCALVHPLVGRPRAVLTVCAGAM